MSCGDQVVGSDFIGDKCIESVPSRVTNLIVPLITNKVELYGDNRFHPG
jgi:hypothetical protein